MLPVDVPEWEPLLNSAPDHVHDFMWMYSVELKDGTRLQAYKHYWTRGYLHLDNLGRSFVYTDRERYREVNLAWLLSRVLREALVEELADEAERGDDLSTARRESVGRPALSGEGASPRISFRASPELNAAAQRRADEEGKSLSELAREALTSYLAS